MKKFLICFILLLYPQGLNSHVSHYKNIKKIEMEIFKDGKNIGYCNYEFTKNNDSIKIYNETNFEVKLLGIKVFSINSIGTEIYKNNKLFSFNSNTLQNDKKKFVNLILNENEDVFDIKGSSYTGKANRNNIIGNWWNHKILESETQISPLSGSVKAQVVTFLGKEKVQIYGKEYLAHKFSLKSKDESISENKKLDFEIWLEPKKNLILKVKYNRMGSWEYILKNVIVN
tara:strand:- start:47 stop:733 length:687 start_codon:yes stop_codon:yes gene_type:complete